MSSTPNCTHYYPDIFLRKERDPKIGDDFIASHNQKYRRLYIATRYLLKTHFSFHPGTVIPEKPEDFHACPDPDKGSRDRRINFLAVYGLMLAKNFVDPAMGRADSVSPGPDDIPVPSTEAGKSTSGVELIIVPAFVQGFVEAVKEYNASQLLFEKTAPIVETNGTVEDGSARVVTLYTRQFAEVVRRLVDDRINPADPQLQLRVLNALGQVIGSITDGSASGTDITLPDLDAGTAVDIIADNVRALGAVYMASQLEEMKVFQVADRVVEHFMSGMLPISRGPGGEKIYQYLKDAPNRLTETERRNLFGRAFGLAQGAGNDVLPNRDFPDLWIRFLSAVSIFNRQADQELKRVTSEQALKSARDLAVNLSLHGFGVAHFAAVELQKLINVVKDMLSSPDVIAAYGCRDWYQLVDRVSALYLGGSVNGVRYRTTAQAGAKIILFLAEKAPILSSVAAAQQDLSALFKDDGIKLNVERWLAVTGTQDQTVEKFSEPIEVSQQFTIPTMNQPMVPDAVRGVLNQVNQMTNGIAPALPITGGVLPQA